MSTVLLVHGGLWDDGMDAERFWHKPGIVAGLERRGFDVLAPDRFVDTVATFAAAEGMPRSGATPPRV